MIISFFILWIWSISMHRSLVHRSKPILRPSYIHYILSLLSFDLCLTFIHLCTLDSFFSTWSLLINFQSLHVHAKKATCWNQTIFVSLSHFALSNIASSSFEQYHEIDMIIFNRTYSKHIKLISHLIGLSLNHQNPLEGLDALSTIGFDDYFHLSFRSASVWFR